MEQLSSVTAAIKAFYNAQKYILTTSYASVSVAFALGKKNKGPGVQITLGREPALSEKIDMLGNKHEETNVDGIVNDTKNKIMSVGAFGASSNATAASVFSATARLVESYLEAENTKQ